MAKRKFLDEEEIQDVLQETNDSESEFSITSDSENKSISSFESESNSDKRSDNTVYLVDWTSTGRARQPFAFIADPGVKFEVADKSSPPEFFEKFFDDQVIELIAIETNRFAKQTIEAAGVESLPKKARLREWYDTSAEEIKLYVALLILQGIDSKSENRFYFGKRESVRNSLFPKVMSSRRFKMISKFLRFVDKY